MDRTRQCWRRSCRSSWSPLLCGFSSGNKRAGSAAFPWLQYFGPGCLMAFGPACQQLVLRNAPDGLLLVLVMAVTTGLPRASSWGYRHLAWAAGQFAQLPLPPGILSGCTAAQRPNRKMTLTRSEVLGLIERDLAGWLALHADPAGAVLLAPPNATTALLMTAAMRGMGAVSRENKEGVAAAVLILKNQNLQEAKAMIDQRKITHVILLSWDPEFPDEYTRFWHGSKRSPCVTSSSLQGCCSGCGHWLIPCRSFPVSKGNR